MSFISLLQPTQPTQPSAPPRLMSLAFKHIVPYLATSGKLGRTPPPPPPDKAVWRSVRQRREDVLALLTDEWQDTTSLAKRLGLNNSQLLGRMKHLLKLQLVQRREAPEPIRLTKKIIQWRKK